MRVAIVTESFLPTVNGVTNSVVKILDHLAERGHEAMVLCPTAGAPAEYRGFPVHEMATLGVRDFPVGLPTLSMQRLIDAFAPDIVHAASPFLLGGQALGIARKRGIPSIAVFQTDVAGYSGRHRLGLMRDATWAALRYIHGLADRTLAPSSASIADLAAARIERVHHWGRGVDVDGFHPRHRDHPDVRAARRRARGRCIVGYVGRLAPEKQVERLDALRCVPGLELVVVGEGPSEESVRSSLRGMRVRYTGRLTGEALARAYASFDIFVHTGTEETFGQTLQEAHATGLPVVAPRAGGPIDLVDEGVTGMLFDPDGGPAPLRDAVALLASDATLRARMGEAGRRRVLGRSWSTVCDQLLEHYEAVRMERAELVSR